MRPTKLTPKRREDVARHLRAGNTVETASALAGLASNTVRRWIRRGREAHDRLDGGLGFSEDDRKFLDFWRVVEGALAEAEAEALAHVRSAAAEDWRAAAWYLARGRPLSWGERMVAAPTSEEEEVDAFAAQLDESAEVRSALLSAAHAAAALADQSSQSGPAAEPGAVEAGPPSKVPGGDPSPGDPGG